MTEPYLELKVLAVSLLQEGFPVDIIFAHSCSLRKYLIIEKTKNLAAGSKINMVYPVLRIQIRDAVPFDPWIWDKFFPDPRSRIQPIFMRT